MEVIRFPPQLHKVDSDEKIDINNTPFSIGRGLNCNHVITSKLVSRVHCIFTLTDEGWILTDKSTNGTTVNGNLLKGVGSDVLLDGDNIVLTSAPFIYKFVAPSMNVVDISDEQLCVIADKVESEVQHEEMIKKRDADGAGETDKKKMKTVEGDGGGDVKDQPGNMNEQIAHPQGGAAAASASPTDSHMDTVEDELTCSICSELFIKAVTLNCSHSFCKYCIEMWQKNKSICPICRANITRTNATLVLDNFIAKVLEKASDDVKEHRKKLIADRASEDEKNAPKQSTGRGRRRGGGANNNANNINHFVQSIVNQTGAPASGTLVQHGDVVIELSDNDSNEDDDDDSSYFDDSDIEIFNENWEEDYMNDEWYSSGSGRSGPYYGGYGACYSCGERGHWANGCPNRNRR